MRWVSVAVLCACVAAASATDLRCRLGESVSRFHTARLELSASKTRRGADKAEGSLTDTVGTLDVFGEPFTLRLRPDASIFARDVRFVAHRDDGATAFDVDLTRFHKGVVEGVPNSFVHAYHDPDQGTLDGVARLGPDRYLHFEPLSKYAVTLNEAASHAQHNMVVYWRSDVIMNHTSSPHTEVCGSEVHARMRQKQEQLSRLRAAMNGQEDQQQDDHEQDEEPAVASRQPRHYRLRPRRDQADQCEDNCICSVALLADHKFFTGPLASNDRLKAVSQMVTFLTDVDSIYGESTFDDETGFGFAIQDVFVYESATATGNPVPGATYTADKYLETLSNFKDWSQYCLIHLFTYRDFEDGILGLAWVGSPNGAGGVCDKGGLNSGFTTALNFGSTVSSAVSMITLAHEFGHNWGSPHDSDSDPVCTPGTHGSPDGNYIMYAQATDGTRTFNTRFSPCSESSITSTLRSRRSQCFGPSAESVCGNGIVEGDEPCDCGQNCDKDPCCQPGCKLADGAACSPQDPLRFPCCTAQCEVTQAGGADPCLKAGPCTEASFCNGVNASCPDPGPKPDLTVCNCRDNNCTAFPSTATKVCEAGTCSRSICTLLNGTECKLTGTRACELGCQGPGWGDGQECVSTYPSEKQRPDNVYGIGLPAGSPCENYEGYCDQSRKCITVDSEDLLDKLNKYLDFSPADAWAWIKNNWPYILAGVGGCLLLGLALRVTYPKRKGTRRGYQVIDDDDDDRESFSMGGSRHAAPWGYSTPWLMKTLSKADAECILGSAAVDGAFLVRKDPRSSDGHVLSLLCAGKVAHHTIVYDDGLGRFYLQFSPTLKFDSISQLVNHFHFETEGILPCRLLHAVAFGSLKGKTPLSPA